MRVAVRFCFTSINKDTHMTTPIEASLECDRQKRCIACMETPIPVLKRLPYPPSDCFASGNCITVPPEFYFSLLPPSVCGTRSPEFSCMRTGCICPQHNATDYEWIFSMPNKYNALLGLRERLYPNNCFYDDVADFETP